MSSAQHCLNPVHLHTHLDLIIIRAPIHSWGLELARCYSDRILWEKGYLHPIIAVEVFVNAVLASGFALVACSIER